MDATDQSEMIQGYLADRLPEADRRAFEDRLLSDPALVQLLESSLQLREGLAMLRDRHELLPLQQPSWWKQRYRVVVGLASAAALAFAAVVSYPWLAHQGRGQSVLASSLADLGANAGAPLPVTERYSFAAVRAETETPVVILPTNGALELRALTRATEAGRTFRVTIDKNPSSDTKSRIGVVEHAAPDGDGFVAVYANASTLEPGDYSLAVEPEVADGSGENRFAFKLEFKAP